MTLLYQASCVAVAGRGLMIAGPPGSGKSSLALALIDRGAVLVGDDGVSLTMRDSALWADPPPNTAGLIEVRNVGLVRFPSCSAPVALLLRLDTAAPRHVEQVDRLDILDTAIPSLTFDPRIAGGAIRAELALRRHGA